MIQLAYIILTTFVIALIAFIGVFTLAMKEHLLNKILIILGIFLFFVTILVVMIALIGSSSFSDFSKITADEVAVVPLKGAITEQTQRDAGKMLDEAFGDASVKAIVLDIDSPGGSVLPSKEIMYSVIDGKDETHKPVIARIGSSGASGAYYVASAADWIIADEDSITGSIGVSMILMQYHELLDKIGVDFNVIISGEPVVLYVSTA